MPEKRELYPQQEKVSRFYYFFPLFWAILYARYIPIQTLIITLLRNIVLTVPKGLPVVKGEIKREESKQIVSCDGFGFGWVKIRFESQQEIGWGSDRQRKK